MATVPVFLMFIVTFVGELNREESMFNASFPTLGKTRGHAQRGI